MDNPPTKKRNAWLSLRRIHHEEAHIILREASFVLYLLAILQGVIGFFLYSAGIADGIIYLVLGFFVGRQSRLASILFLVAAVLTLATTFAAMSGVINGGHNWILASVIVWVAIRCVQAAFAYKSTE